MIALFTSPYSASNSLQLITDVDLLTNTYFPTSSTTAPPRLPSLSSPSLLKHILALSLPPAPSPSSAAPEGDSAEVSLPHFDDINKGRSSAGGSEEGVGKGQEQGGDGGGGGGGEEQGEREGEGWVDPTCLDFIPQLVIDQWTPSSEGNPVVALRPSA